MKRINQSDRFQNTNRRLVMAAAGILTALAAICARGQSSTNDWQSHAISPVANPIYFEDPRVTTEARPIFMEHQYPETYAFNGGKAPLGGGAQVYALQLRYAINDRLGLIATKDGYIASNPEHTVPDSYGWGNVSAGLKYALVDDREDAFILTPGFTVELPIGNPGVFQGNGAGLWNIFASAEKGWNDFHLTGNGGVLVPDDFSKQTAELHYSLQADYYVCRYFIPFVVGNGYTTMTAADNKLLGAVNMNTEMNDLSDFGATKAAGRSQLIAGLGFRSRITRHVDTGFSWEYGVTKPQGIFRDRYTIDAILHF